jgi:hypothetical protein
VTARRVRRAAGALVVCGSLVVTGCSGEGSSSRPTGSGATTVATNTGTPLEDVDTTALAVPRAPFCDLVEPTAVPAALGEQATDASTYRSGQRTEITWELTDVVHEFGCSWTAGASSAEAWVFAPPVTRERATRLVTLARERAGCGKLTGAAEYGDPSIATSCRGDTGIVLSCRGLFGDAWLACALTSPGGQQEELVDRAGRWCAAVATGAARGA